MSEFFVNIWEYSFITNAVIAILLSSVACGISGTFIVVKKISYISGGIAHAVMGGLGIAYFWGVNPIYGAFGFALLSALLLGIVKLRSKENIDTLISALWAVGMALGIIFAYLTPGYNVDLLSFLFGNILMISESDLILLAILDLFILGTVTFFYQNFVHVSFDEENAKLRGINVEATYLLLLIIIAITVVILVQTVGLILVIAILTLPSAIALMFSDNIFKAILLSASIILILMISGFVISFYSNLPSGAVIILLTGLVYIITLFAKNGRSMLRG